MQENLKAKSISKKTAICIMIGVLIFALIAITAVITGHTIYQNNQKTLITNYNTDFKVTSPQILLYLYENDALTVDMGKVIEVSKGASFEITKIQDEDGSVVRPDGLIIDVAQKPQRLAVVRVTSASGKKTADYRISLAPKSSENNIIDYNVDSSILGNDVFSNYTGMSDFVLPQPVKEYTGASGNTVRFGFHGWYTTPDFEEGSEISVIPAGNSGKVSLYAKFDNTALLDARDGHKYVYFGKYPQSEVKEYNLLKRIKASSEYANASGDFTFEGVRYMKFRPTNQPNVSANGYSTSSTYVFKYEPVEWRILQKKDAVISDGSKYSILATSVLNCASYQEDVGFIQNMYDMLAGTIKVDITSFVRKYFDPDSMYEASDLKKATDPLYDAMFTAADKGQILAKTLQKYKNTTSSTKEDYSVNVWNLSYSEAITPDLGFNPDFRYNDNLRKATVADYAAACGAFVSDSQQHYGQGTWWLRGAGSRYGFNDKRIAYVKYTGYVHAYGAMNFAVRSGIRPAVDITYNATAFPVA